MGNLPAYSTSTFHAAPERPAAPAERGGARLWRGLDRRLSMGEGSAAGVPWGDRRGTGDVGRLEGGPGVALALQQVGCAIEDSR